MSYGTLPYRRTNANSLDSPAKGIANDTPKEHSRRKELTYFMGKTFIAPILFTVLLVSCLTVHAKEWISEDSDIIFQIPDDSSWNQIPPPVPPVKFALQRTDKTADILFFNCPAPEDGKVLDQFIPEFEKGCWPPGKSVKRTGEFLSFKGKKAYKTTGELFINDITFETGIIVWIENDKVFEISAMKRDADPFEDPIIKTFFDTIKFSSGSVK
jgi:hypothetical protein